MTKAPFLTLAPCFIKTKDELRSVSLHRVRQHKKVSKPLATHADLTQTAVPSESVIPAGAKCAAGSKLADRMAYIVHTCSSLKKCFSIDAFALYSL